MELRSYPYKLYDAQFSIPSVRRIGIVLLCFLFTVLSCAVYGYMFGETPAAVWGLLLIAAFYVWLARWWMGAGQPNTRRVLHFDQQCQHFLWTRADERVEFRSEEALFVGHEQGELIFSVRGRELSFPQFVTAAGTVRTALHLGAMTGTRAMNFVVEFEREALKVRGVTAFGERLDYNTLF